MRTISESFLSAGLLLLLAAGVGPGAWAPVAAQPAAFVSETAEAAHVPHYAVKRNVTVYTTPDSTRPYLHLRLREPVEILAAHGPWRHVRTSDGATGYVYHADLSSVWIRISKKEQTLYLYEGARLVTKIPADFGQNVFADKERRGSLTNPDDWRTPTGVFFIAHKNPRSQYYKALVLNYPSAEDADRGLRQGYITREQYEAIVRAEEEIRMPPMNTPLGGWIEIHGHGTGARTNWTQGCVAVANPQMDVLWQRVHVGTPVLIEP